MSAVHPRKKTGVHQLPSQTAGREQHPARGSRQRQQRGAEGQSGAERARRETGTRRGEDGPDEEQRPAFCRHCTQACHEAQVLSLCHISVNLVQIPHPCSTSAIRERNGRA